MKPILEIWNFNHGVGSDSSMEGVEWGRRKEARGREARIVKWSEGGEGWGKVSECNVGGCQQLG